MTLKEFLDYDLAVESTLDDGLLWTEEEAFLDFAVNALTDGLDGEEKDDSWETYYDMGMKGLAEHRDTADCYDVFSPSETLSIMKKKLGAEWKNDNELVLDCSADDFEDFIYKEGLGHSVPYAIEETDDGKAILEWDDNGITLNPYWSDLY